MEKPRCPDRNLASKYKWLDYLWDYSNDCWVCNMLGNLLSIYNEKVSLQD